MFLAIALVAVAAMVVLGAARLLIPAGGADAATGQAARGGGRPTVVTLTPVILRPFSSRIDVLGVAKGRQSVTLTADTTELVTKIFFRSGQAVRQGQVLAQLNAREQTADIGQYQAALALAEQNLQRYQTLADKGIAAKATVDQYRGTRDQALATVEAAKARAANRVIRAPFSGNIGLTDAAPGMLLNPGSSIATLDDTSVIRVDFPVPERFLSVLREGLQITATADAYPSENFRGVIAKLDTRIDPNTRAITARAEFPNGNRRLKPGMLMHVAIDQAQRESASAPESALLFEDDKAFVFVARPDPNKGQIAVRRPVSVGVRHDGVVEITDGLKPGDMVIADGLNRVRPNEAIVPAGQNKHAA
jgi:membrane fusion protein (multidrug efflux system)